VQFLSESAMLSGLGGVLGWLRYGNPSWGIYAPVPSRASVARWAISVSTLVGLFFGIYQQRIQSQPIVR